MHGTFPVAAVVAALACTARSDVLHVDDSAAPGGDGSSWGSAYTHLQDALADAAASGGVVTEIRVGQGTYAPDLDEAGNVTPGDRGATFQLITGVTLNGGFAGLGAPDPDLRNVRVYETVLTGDLLGNDLPGFTNYEDNSWSVVTATGTDGTAVLDGFTVTAGYADDFSCSGAQAAGGGMYNESGAPTVSNCRFTLNDACAGGGMYNRGGNTTVIDCVFDGNTATLGSEGAGMYNEQCSPVIVGCLFTGNSAESRGGGMHNVVNGNATVIGCDFVGNIAQHGGGISIVFSSCFISGCQFIMNSAESNGGGIVRIGGSTTSLTIVDSTFTGNTAGDTGGGLRDDVSNLQVSRCVFVGNHSEFGGGGVALDGDAVVTDSLFASNTALDGGGLIQLSFGAVSMINCTVVDNTATGGQSGGILLDTGPVRNCVVWANAPGQIGDLFELDLVVTYSDVEGGWPGPGNIDANPLFVSPVAGDYRLQQGSPAIDAGHNWAIAGLSDVDLDGNARFAADENDFDSGCGVPVVVDMGPYEYQGDPFPVRLGDVDGDGVVGIVDLLALLAAWGACADPCCLADLDLDAVVGISDFLALLENWTDA